MENGNSTIARRIKAARLRAGLSQTALGVAAGMDPSVASPAHESVRA